MKNLEEQVLYGQISAADAAQQLFDGGNEYMAEGQE